MTTEEAITFDIWDCGTATRRGPHEWAYLGKVAQKYRCNRCHEIVTKAVMRELTNA